MAITATTRLGLPQWSAGSDSPSRTAFNGAFAAIDAKAAMDLGEVGTAAVPITDVVAGRYASVVNGAYRQLYRRTVSGWVQVGGQTWAETTYSRADAALPTNAAARVVSHPSLGNAGITEYWDGSTTRGARQAIGDLNAGAPGALHVGDISSPVDLVTRGRVYALTAGSGGRGFVATAHAAAAGPLYAARDSGGSEPWLIDSLGRMRAQAPTAFGAAALAVNVPFISAPGASDLTAMDLVAAPGKPALRLFRAPGDSIGSVLPDAIALGKTSWTGGVVTVTAPTINLTGNVTVTGTLSASTTVSGGGAMGSSSIAGTLDVSGQTTLAAVNATSLYSSGALGVAGTSTLATTTTTNLSASGTLGIAGVSTLAAVNGTNINASGTLGVGGVATLHNTTVIGTLAVSSTSTLASTTATTLTTSGTATLANASVTGAFGVSGTSTLAAVNGTNINASGTLGATGISTLGTVNAAAANVSGVLDVNGTSVLAAVTATNVTASGTLGVTGVSTLGTTNTGALSSSSATLASASVTGTLTAQGGNVATAVNGSGAEVRTRPPVQLSGTAQQSVRASAVAMRTINPAAIFLTGSEDSRDITFTMPEDGWLRLDSEISIVADLGSGGTFETLSSFWVFDIRSGASVVGAGYTHSSNITTDDTGRQVEGHADVHFTDVYPTRLSAGSYTLRARFSKLSVLGGSWATGRFWFTPVVLHSTS